MRTQAEMVNRGNGPQWGLEGQITHQETELNSFICPDNTKFKCIIKIVVYVIQILGSILEGS